MLAADLATGDRGLPWATDAGPWLLGGFAIARDQLDERILTGDTRHAAVWTTELGDGAHAELSGPNVGAGMDIVTPLAVAADATRILVISDYTGKSADETTSKLMSIDRVSGDRTIIGSTLYGASHDGLALTNDGRALVTSGSSFCGAAILAVDLVTGVSSTITRIGADPVECAYSDMGTGPSLGRLQAIAFDPAGNRALLADEFYDSVRAVSLATGVRSVVSDASTGAGPMLQDPIGMALDEASNRALTIDRMAGALVAVDLATGDRAVLSSPTVGEGPVFTSPISIAEPDADGLVPVHDAVLRGVLIVDAATGERVLLEP